MARLRTFGTDIRARPLDASQNCCKVPAGQVLWVFTTIGSNDSADAVAQRCQIFSERHPWEDRPPEGCRAGVGCERLERLFEATPNETRWCNASAEAWR